VKSSLLQKVVGLAAIAATGAGLLATAPVAHAVPYTGNNVVVAAAGSDTTENFMGTYLPNFDGRTDILAGQTLHTYNIRAFPSSALSVPGDPNSCPQDVSWTQTVTSPPAQQIAPSGSGSGKTYFATQDTNAAQRGCVDISRSSSNPGTLSANPTQEKSSWEYYAFALDAVTWASSSLKAPATLTKQQVKDIYNCVYTNWDQVGGTSGPIQRYTPQTGSGTYAFGLSAWLDGVTPPNSAANVAAGCPDVKNNSVLNPAGGANIKFEENQGKLIEPADYDKAIMWYSAGVWSYQAANSANPDIDVRNGVRLGGLTTVTGPVKGNPVEWSAPDRAYQLNFSAGGVVNESNVAKSNPAFSSANGYVGIRYVYNILNNNGNLLGYQAAFDMVGFSNVAAGFKSPLCNNEGVTDDQTFARAAVLSNGFAPLPASNNPLGSNAAGGTCRKFTPAA
jgi:ABC-type phosphate transport system substrate-binding protein